MPWRQFQKGATWDSLGQFGTVCRFVDRFVKNCWTFYSLCTCPSDFYVLTQFYLTNLRACYVLAVSQQSGRRRFTVTQSDSEFDSWALTLATFLQATWPCLNLTGWDRGEKGVYCTSWGRIVRGSKYLRLILHPHSWAFGACQPPCLFVKLFYSLNAWASSYIFVIVSFLTLFSWLSLQVSIGIKIKNTCKNNACDHLIII